MLLTHDQFLRPIQCFMKIRKLLDSQSISQIAVCLKRWGPFPRVLLELSEIKFMQGMLLDDAVGIQIKDQDPVRIHHPHFSWRVGGNPLIHQRIHQPPVTSAMAPCPKAQEVVPTTVDGDQLDRLRLVGCPCEVVHSDSWPHGSLP